jgi:hypothetical protein
VVEKWMEGKEKKKGIQIEVVNREHGNLGYWGRERCRSVAFGEIDGSKVGGREKKEGKKKTGNRKEL